ncbi:hypothetical protein EVAR_22951_1 [Eumeta japonica]|uniref:Uncharacterized protein n=1 Tax=Eumeta variegata TaxID=151549 RepID=A0A4C1UQ86_EUMVA|nr:hypothetical protein EVAR_22951_1 [Eumeta japonica]
MIAVFRSAGGGSERGGARARQLKRRPSFGENIACCVTPLSWYSLSRSLYYRSRGLNLRPFKLPGAVGRFFKGRGIKKLDIDWNQRRIFPSKTRRITEPVDKARADQRDLPEDSISIDDSVKIVGFARRTAVLDIAGSVQKGHRTEPIRLNIDGAADGGTFGT